MTWTGLLFTAGVQLTSAIINCHNNKKKVEKIKKLQRDDKEERQEDWMRGDYERFKRNLNLQMQIEEDAQCNCNGLHRALGHLLTQLTHTF